MTSFSSEIIHDGFVPDLWRDFNSFNVFQRLERFQRLLTLYSVVLGIDFKDIRRYRSGGLRHGLILLLAFTESW